MEHGKVRVNRVLIILVITLPHALFLINPFLLAFHLQLVSPHLPLSGLGDRSLIGPGEHHGCPYPPAARA